MYKFKDVVCFSKTTSYKRQIFVLVYCSNYIKNKPFLQERILFFSAVQRVVTLFKAPRSAFEVSSPEVGSGGLTETKQPQGNIDAFIGAVLLKTLRGRRASLKGSCDECTLKTAIQFTTSVHLNHLQLWFLITWHSPFNDIPHLFFSPQNPVLKTLPLLPVKYLDVSVARLLLINLLFS